MRVQEPTGSILIRQGAGLHHTGGSQAVRDVQRRLIALGYRPGPVDGAFGPRTRSAVAWFQIKHRLAPTGAVDGRTLNLLRYRTHGHPRKSARSAAPVAPASPAPDPAAPALKPDAAAAPRPAVPAPRAVTSSNGTPHGAAVAPHRDAAPAAAPSAGRDRGNSGAFIVWVLAALAFQLVVLALIRNWPLIRPLLPERARLAGYRRRLGDHLPHFSGLIGRTPQPGKLRRWLPRRAQLIAIGLKPARLAAGFVSARRRSTRSQPPRVPARLAAARRGRPPRAAAATPLMPAPTPAVSVVPGTVVAGANGKRVIGYALARSDGDFARQQRAMERVCDERGWTLAALVKERPGAQPKQRRQPGLTHVLGQVARGGVAQLIVGRLHSLARTPAELAALLDWCSRHDVGLVALDVGLDTSTADGRLAARCLGAVAGSPARAQAAQRRSNGVANGRGNVQGDGHSNGNGHTNGNGHHTNGHHTNGNGAPGATEVS